MAKKTRVPTHMMLPPACLAAAYRTVVGHSIGDVRKQAEAMAVAPPPPLSDAELALTLPESMASFMLQPPPSQAVDPLADEEADEEEDDVVDDGQEQEEEADDVGHDEQQQQQQQAVSSLPVPVSVDGTTDASAMTGTDPGMVIDEGRVVGDDAMDVDSVAPLGAGIVATGTGGGGTDDFLFAFDDASAVPLGATSTGLVYDAAYVDQMHDAAVARLPPFLAARVPTHGDYLRGLLHASFILMSAMTCAAADSDWHEAYALHDKARAAFGQRLLRPSDEGRVDVFGDMDWRKWFATASSSSSSSSASGDATALPLPEASVLKAAYHLIYFLAPFKRLFETGLPDPALSSSTPPAGGRPSTSSSSGGGGDSSSAGGDGAWTPLALATEFNLSGDEAALLETALIVAMRPDRFLQQALAECAIGQRASAMRHEVGQELGQELVEPETKERLTAAWTAYLSAVVTARAYLCLHEEEGMPV